KPTRNPYCVGDQLGSAAPSARTIHGGRKRNGIARLPKRAPPRTPARGIPERVGTRLRHILTRLPQLDPKRARRGVLDGEQLQMCDSAVNRHKRKMHDTHHRAPRALPPPAWRFYERHHPHSLWHADFMDKITLTDPKEQVHQLTLQDHYTRGYVFSDLAL